MNSMYPSLRSCENCIAKSRCANRDKNVLILGGKSGCADFRGFKSKKANVKKRGGRYGD